MHITFNAMHTGLENTGGCKTIIKSAQTLTRMGHKVTITTRKNNYTWEQVETVKTIPQCDACIAISVLDIKSSLKSGSKPFYWMRGYEHWLMQKKEINKLVKKITTFANSGWLGERFGVPVVYAGLDFDSWRDTHTRKGDTVGFLYNDRLKTKQTNMAKRLNYALKGTYRVIGLGQNGAVYGDALCTFYNQCDLWFSPSILEGFHNPPAEALMCGCLPLVINQKRGGTEDYVKHGHTGLRYDTLEQATEYVKEYISSLAKERIVNDGQELIRTKIGSREQNMQKLVELL